MRSDTRAKIHSVALDLVIARRIAALLSDVPAEVARPVAVQAACAARGAR